MPYVVRYFFKEIKYLPQEPPKSCQEKKKLYDTVISGSNMRNVFMTECQMTKQDAKLYEQYNLILSWKVSPEGSNLEC